MGVIKRINVNNTEKALNSIAEMSTNICFLQSEIEHIKSQLKNNEAFLNQGILSKRTFEGNKRSFERKMMESMKEINIEAEELMKLSKNLKKDIEANKL